jgi:hypothetical protein
VNLREVVKMPSQAIRRAPYHNPFRIRAWRIVYRTALVDPKKETRRDHVIYKPAAAFAAVPSVHFFHNAIPPSIFFGMIPADGIHRSRDLPKHTRRDGIRKSTDHKADRDDQQHKPKREHFSLLL